MKCDTLALFNINFRDFAINENRKTDIFLSVSKAKENLLLYFPPFDTIFRYQAVFYYQKGEFYHYDRYRKSALAGQAPIGGSSSTEPSERTKGKNTQAHSDRGKSGKGAAGSANDRAASIGGIPITKNTAKRLKHSEGLRETGGRFLFPKGALTHHLPEAGGGIPPVGRERALSEGDFAFCGKRQTMPQHLPCCCHCLRSCLCRTELAVQTAACENLPPAALSQRWTALGCRPFSLLRKRNRKGNEVIRFGNLPFGGKGGQPWGWPLRCRGGGLSELFPDLQRL